ncbi:threonine aldolase family protein [Pseudomonadota bacterium]
MNRDIELRSDTFTLPDKGMRRAIYEAEVGNAGFGEDPSVQRLEEEVADYFGLAAGVFLPSATMAGQIAIRVWSRPGDIVIIEEYGHSYYFETGAMAAISGTQARLVKGTQGILDSKDIEAVMVHPENDCARSSLLILENTSNFGGGTIYPRETLEQIFILSRDLHLPVHIDGARIWNAIVATGNAASSQVPPGGSLSVCFSKGLGAPMGALLLGSADFIAEARRIQKMLGGVMRQVGFMAAGALYGFRHNLDRLAEDHANASLLARVLASNLALEIDLEAVQTNIIYFRVKEGPARASRLIGEMNAHRIKAFNLGSLVRLVTNLNVTRQDCEHAAATINKLMD